MRVLFVYRLKADVMVKAVRTLGDSATAGMEAAARWASGSLVRP